MKKVSRSILSILLMTSTFLSVSVLNSFGAEDTALQRMLLRLKPAVVLIHTRIDAKIATNIGVIDLAPPIVTTGTGFIISQDGYLLTNGHVVEMYQERSDYKLQLMFADRLKKVNDPNKKYIKNVSAIKIDRKLYAVLSNGEHFVAEIKQFSPPLSQEPGKSSVTGINYKVMTETGKDVAVLKIEGRDYPTVPLADSEKVQLGEPIYVIGYPGVVLQHDYLSNKTALDSTVTIGHVSGSKLDVKGTPVIQTDAPLTWGNSGGPAFNSNGQVVGIATFISIS